MNRPPITHVAIRFRDKVWSLPAPNRHADVMQMINSSDFIRMLREGSENDPAYVSPYPSDECHGFLDADGTFLNRRQALYNAQKNNQIKPGTKIKLGQLFSEDVW